MSHVGLLPHLVLLAALLGGARAGKWCFDKDAVGAKPAGFSFETSQGELPGDWKVLDDAGNKVLAQLDESAARRRYALAIAKDVKVEDVDMSVRIKAVKGEHEQAGGVIWRVKNRETYLVARLDVTDDNVRLFRFWDGNRVQIGIKGKLGLKTGEWYTLRVEHDDKQIKVYLNGDIMFIEHDKHFHHPGRVGLWTKSHSVMYFDDFEVKNLDDDEDDND